MNFFKSILSDDTEPENLDNHEKSGSDTRPNQSPQHQEIERAEDDHSNSNSTSSRDVSGAGGLWSFGDLVKTLTTRSESVLETYRRDLKEFGSGLRKESDLFREVASRAVKELPSSIEVGASAIDGVLKSTADIISQGKDVFLVPSDINDSDASEALQNHSRGYSRFDSQLNAIQSDSRTYCEDPEDLDDYSKWKLGFVLGDYKIEIEKLIGDNQTVESIYKKLVPDEVVDESFWCRYFYRVHKLKQQEDMRANFVRRSLTVDDEEELSWDVDEEEEVKPNSPEIETKQSSNVESEMGNSNVVDEDPVLNKNNSEDPESSGDQKVESVKKSEENLDGDLSKEAEDLEWDEIGDLGADEKKVSQGDTPKKADLLKRMNVVEDDEDLNWDIEDDDDEPVKAGNSK